MKTIGFVSCVSMKQSRPCLARDMYTSPLFKLSRNIVERHTSRWFILSAKYGLLDPNDIIEPYEMTLKNMSKKDRTAWADKVREQIRKKVGDNNLVVLAGNHYMAPFEGLSNKVITPLAKLEIGKRLHRLKVLGS